MHVQGSPEWLEMRKNYLGGSDAPAVMGVSPYRSRYQLWEEKVGLGKPQEVHAGMERGLHLEAEARAKLETLTGNLFAPEVKFHPKISYMMASLDGIDPEGKAICEIKCPNRDDHAMALMGRIPDKYYPQIQHQLEVCGVEVCFYFSYREGEGHVIEVPRNEQYIKTLLSQEEEFWERNVLTFEAPELEERDFVIIDHPQWHALSREMLDIHTRKKELEAEEKRIKDEIVRISNNQNCKGHGLRVSHFVRKGPLDYSYLPEEVKAELEKHRKPPIKSVRVSLT